MRVTNVSHPAAVAAAALLMIPLAALPSAAAVVRIAGSPDRDVINGTDRDENIRGLAGNDTIRSRAGQDRVDAGPGNDRVSLGAGAWSRPRRGDWAWGRRGNDVLKGNDGVDALYGGKGSDILRGGRGIDWLIGNSGSDRLYGGPSRDHMHSGNLATGAQTGGDDLLFGGSGPDAIYIADGRQFVMSEAGDDLIVIFLDDGRADLIDCGPGDDEVYQYDGIDPHDSFVNCEVSDGEPARLGQSRRRP